MSFVHEDSEFGVLVRIVAATMNLSPALVEKDYWVTHTLWALHEAGLEVWFKGGTSLSKGFGLIQRFSEDLDLKIAKGSVMDLPDVSSWTSESKGRVRQRQEYFEALESAIVVPGADVSLDRELMDPRSRTANYKVEYGGQFLAELGPAFRPYVLLEVGSARVTPHENRHLSSFIHDWLEQQGRLGEFDENRPRDVRCLHPLVSLIEKLDAISKRYSRETFEPATFVRHYEDAAKIVESAANLPPLAQPLRELAEEMRANKQIAALPTASDPGLLLAEPTKRAAVEKAYAATEAMFWGARLGLLPAVTLIREWLERQFPND